MSRPGCVWTHTLLIDFTDLGKLVDATDLITKFRRPAHAQLSGYDKPIEVHDNDQAGLHEDHASAVWAERVLAALYGRPRSRIFMARPTQRVNVEEIVLAIWAQQWPRLRRSFRFCTLTSVDRSSDASLFDLQILPQHDRGVRSRFTGAFDADHSFAPAGEWLAHAVTDLLQPNEADLRQFLRRVGGDVMGGRRAYSALAQLHLKLSEFDVRPNAVDEAIELLDKELKDVSASAARAIVASEAAKQPDRLSDAALEFLLRHLDLLDDTAVSRHAGAIGRLVMVSRSSPDCADVGS
jgi:hypothetical protein